MSAREWFAKPATLLFSIITGMLLYVFGMPVVIWFLRIVGTPIDRIIQAWWDFWLK